MTALLRGSRKAGYRTTAPMSCPHCTQEFHLSGQANEDRQGPHLALWPVARTEGEYSEAELRHVVSGPPGETGVSLPQTPGHTRLLDDPVPKFDGTDGT